MINHDLTDTIAAIATPVGEGGIGIVRISGKLALAIADKIFISPAGKLPSTLKTYTTHYGTIVKGKKVIDEVILTIMRSPKSYTREDIVEINCHGGIVALRGVLDLVLASGARMARPGEFTKRAFLNGRIDLTQAEAVLDIIRAKTDSALKTGIEQLKGSLSKQINKYRELLLNILAQLEAGIDFPEELVSTEDLKTISRKLDEVHNGLEGLIKDSRLARILREGIHVVICGKPNVGKSSLLNALLKEERSIVTPIAGTTRDTIEEVIDIQGIPVRIVDTAGILEPRDLVEKEAVKRSKEQIAAADLIIILFDASKKLSPEDLFLIRKLKKKKVIALINKSDLKQKIEKGRLEKIFKSVVDISAKKLINIDLLEKAIADLVYGGSVAQAESLLVANLRHRNMIQKAKIIIAQARESLDNSLPAEFIAQDLKEALGHLDEVSGRKFSEDLLDKIFSEFCIGK
ncbi:MAG: tRNA uridine-5-carboxymethylaminomethyl(34) synthesis GTPase MnmE [Candidatus Omnitrophica bacterium]|nr:tRNA uridine-5-carboxymethylaminomethyl(34) synthesis GTPase MnmE [Candidatus Omnitrophota bacterium]